MKKIIVALLMFTLLFCSCTDVPSSPKLEMTNESGERITEPVDAEIYHKLYQSVDQENIFQYGPYCFFKNSDGNAVVIKYYDHDLKIIERAERYPATHLPSVSDFEQVKEGMDMFEVVELVGLPARSVTFGLVSLDFLTASQDIFFRMSFELSGSSYVVLDISQCEEPQTAQ